MRIVAVIHSHLFNFYINGYQEKEEVKILLVGNGDARSWFLSFSVGFNVNG